MCEQKNQMRSVSVGIIRANDQGTLFLSKSDHRIDQSIPSQSVLHFIVGQPSTVVVSKPHLHEFGLIIFFGQIFGLMQS